jgi:hypothetical protein
MSLRPEIEFVKALLPRRSIFSRETLRGATTMSESKTVLLRAAEWQLARRERGGFKPWTKRMVAVGSTLALTAGAGVAYAAWTSSATGAGTSKATSFIAPTMAAGTAPAGQLYPGLTADGSTVGGDVTVKVSNTNPFPVLITGIAAGTGAITSDAGANCTDQGANPPNPTGVSIITKSSGLTGTNLTVPANTNNVNVTINKVASMSPSSATGCQSAQINFPSTYVVLSFSS